MDLNLGMLSPKIVFPFTVLKGNTQIYLKTREFGAEMEGLVSSGSSSAVPDNIFRMLSKRHVERVETKDEEGSTLLGAAEERVQAGRSKCILVK